MNKIFSIKWGDEKKIYICGIKISIGKPHINNFIYVIDSRTGKKKKVNYIRGINIKFTKHDSSVTVYKPFINFKGNEFILSENCHIIIGNKENLTTSGMQNVKIYMRHGDSKLEIGKDFFNANSLYELDNNSKCTIGNDCMFSSCHILAGDCHKIVDKITKKELNTESNLVVGDHVWIGYNATILKNAKISSGSIVGTNSLVAGKFDEEESVIIAGNPARIIKKNIEWRK